MPKYSADYAKRATGCHGDGCDEGIVKGGVRICNTFQDDFWGGRRRFGHERKHYFHVRCFEKWVEGDYDDYGGEGGPKSDGYGRQLAITGVGALTPDDKYRNRSDWQKILYAVKEMQARVNGVENTMRKPKPPAPPKVTPPSVEEVVAMVATMPAAKQRAVLIALQAK
eukprot:gene8679-23497_t